MRAVFVVAAFIFGLIVCYLLSSLGVVDAVDGIPGTQEEPALSLPTYLGFLSVMMTAVTAVLAAVAIGIIAAYTFRELKDEARKAAEKAAKKVSDDRLSEVKVKNMVFDLYAKAEEERQQDVKWDEEPSEKDEEYERQEENMTSRELKKVMAEKGNILEKYLSTCPVKLGGLARELGVGGILVSSMRTGVSGQIARENGDYLIRVNRYEARERQRFTIAHELAHFLLHKEVIDRSPDGITDNVLYRSGAPEQIEYEANRLAADLIMPMELIRQKLFDDFGGVVAEATIESLAASFQVSKAAMEIRLSTFAEA